MPPDPNYPFINRTSIVITACCVLLEFSFYLTSRKNTGKSTITTPGSESPSKNLPKIVSAGPASEFSKINPDIDQIFRNGSIEEAKQVIKKSVGTEDFEWFIDELAPRLGECDQPEEQLNWLLLTAKGEPLSSALQRFAGALYLKDPLKAVEIGQMASVAKSPELKRRYRYGMIVAAAKKSIPEAATLMEKLQLSNESKKSIVMGLGVEFENRPNDVVRLAEHFPNEIDGHTFGNALFSIWRQSPQAAYKSLSSFTDESNVEQALNPFCYLLSKENPKSASDWIDSLNNVTYRDAALAGYIRGIAGSNPVEALQRATQLGPGKTRESMMNLAAGLAARYDPEQAENLLRNSAMAQSEKDKWISLLQQKREKASQ